MTVSAPILGGTDWHSARPRSLTSGDTAGWGPWGLRFACRLLQDPVSAFPAECFEEHDLLRRVLHRRLFLPTSPAAVRDVLKADGQSIDIARMQMRRFRPAMGEGMIVATGESWKRQRLEGQSIAAEGTRELQVGSFSKVMHARLANGSPDLLGTLKSSLLSQIIDVLFPAGQTRDFPVDEMVGAVDAFVLPRQSMQLADLGVFRTASAPTTHSFDRLIEGEGDRAGLEARLTGSGIPLRDFAVSMLIGFYPTALAVLWLVICASRDPELAMRLHRECSATPVEDISAKEMPVTMAALQETMRLFPPFPFTTRESLQDCELGGIRVRKGTLIITSPWLLHRHKRLWQQPGQFDLDRFVAQKPPRERFMPFGMGARMCIGSALSMRLLLEATHALFSKGCPEIGDSDDIRATGMFLLLPSRKIHLAAL